MILELIEKIENPFDRIKSCCGYSVSFNHSELHDLVKRMKDRGINLSVDEFLLKLRKGLKEAVKYALANNRKEVALYFNKSNFIVILRITKKTKDIYIKTILAGNTKVDGVNIRIPLDEIKAKLDLNENTYYNYEYGFIEPNNALYIDEWIEINE